MAKKGVLWSSPDVDRMTHAMWVAELTAIEDQEKRDREFVETLAAEVVKASSRNTRDTIIHLLGLTLGVGQKPGETPQWASLLEYLLPQDTVRELREGAEAATLGQLPTVQENELAIHATLDGMLVGDMEPA